MLSHSAEIHPGTRRSWMQLANHPPIDFPAEVGYREAVPIHANEPNHLQNAEHRSHCAHRQILAVVSPLLFGAEFVDKHIEGDGLSMRSQDSKDARGCFRTSEEIYQRIFQPLQVSREPRRHLGRAGTGRRPLIHVATDELAANKEQRQRGENERRDDNYNKKRSIHNLWVSLQMKGCGIITGAADCAAAGPRGRAVLRRLGDLIHLAIDVSPAEEK